MISARLNIKIFVDCPECDYLIDLMNEQNTNGVHHDECGDLAEQIFPRAGSHDDFKCDEVTCSQCETTFDVKGLEW